MEWWLKSLFLRWGFVIKRRRQAVVRPASRATGLAPEDLMEAIHGLGIYKGFDFERYPCDLKGWGGDSPAFAELVAEVRPSLIIEVGTWKGASAISMAEAFHHKAGKRLAIPDTLVADLGLLGTIAQGRSDHGHLFFIKPPGLPRSITLGQTGEPVVLKTPDPILHGSRRIIEHGCHLWTTQALGHK